MNNCSQIRRITRASWLLMTKIRHRRKRCAEEVDKRNEVRLRSKDSSLVTQLVVKVTRTISSTSGRTPLQGRSEVNKSDESFRSEYLMSTGKKRFVLDQNRNPISKVYERTLGDSKE